MINSKLVKQNFLKIRKKVIKQKNPVFIVYQMGKVGSKTIFDSISMHYEDVYHTHSHKEAKTIIDNAKPRKTIVICGVREPLTRCISAFFENIDNSSNKYWFYGNKEQCLASSTQQLIDHFSDCYEKHIDEVLEGWFHLFAASINIDIEQFRIDQSKGFCEITERNLCVYVYKLECIDAFISHLENSKYFHQICFSNSNIGRDKWSGEIYDKFKLQYYISQEEYLRIFAGITWVPEFYTEDELRRFALPYISNSEVVPNT